MDSLIVDLAEGLAAAEMGGGLGAARRIDTVRVDRARQLLDAECTRAIHSTELESITG